MPGTAARGWTAARVTRRSSPATGTRLWTRCWARSPSAGPGITAVGAGVAWRPRDAELGVAAATMSPGLAKMTARAAAAAAAIEQQATAITARTLVPLPPPMPRPDKLYIAIDGTGVPMRAAETEGRDGKGEGGKARTREVKLCCCFTQTSVDERGRPVRDPGSSSYLATFAPAAAFGTLMAAEARRRGAGHIRQLTILGDGAAWIWNLATQHFPQATQIVDLYHAREHLHELAKLLEFMLGSHREDWLTARLGELDAGDIPAICAAAHAFPLTGRKADDLKTALGYFEHNAHRMRYQHFRSLGMFIGSGAVEAGCKAVIEQRLKLSGMHWSTPGATGILTLRCQQASGQWEEIWPPPHNRTGAA